MMDSLKVKTAALVADALTAQAELATINSLLWGISEPEFPMELLKEGMGE